MANRKQKPLPRIGKPASPPTLKPWANRDEEPGKGKRSINYKMAVFEDERDFASAVRNYNQKMAQVSKAARTNIEVVWPCSWREAAPMHQQLQAMGIDIFEENDISEATQPYGEIIGKKSQPCVRVTFDKDGNHGTFQINTGKKTLVLKARRPVCDVYGESAILFFGKVQAVLGTTPAAKGKAKGNAKVETKWNPAASWQVHQ